MTDSVTPISHPSSTSGMDLRATTSSPGTGEETQQPRAMDTESMTGQAVVRKVTQKGLCVADGSSTHLAGPESQPEPTASVPEWKAGRNEWMIIIDLAIISLMIALDATILVPVLPVSDLNP